MYKCKCGGMVTDCIGELEDSNNPCICKDLKIESQAKKIKKLKRYAQPKENCGHWTSWPKGCTCSLNKLLKEVK